MPTIQIQIVTWNSKEHLARLFAGINRQAIDYNLLVIDNASDDGAVEMISEMTDVKIIKNGANRGFAAGHNQGFAACRAPFVLVLNPDTELLENFLEQCLKAIQSDERIGAVAGKLYRRLPTEPPLNPPSLSFARDRLRKEGTYLKMAGNDVPKPRGPDNWHGHKRAGRDERLRPYPNYQNQTFNKGGQ